MEGLYVEARVGARLKRYIVGSYQSDIIPLDRDSVLVAVIKPYLELAAPDADPLDPKVAESEVVRIELPMANGKVYCHAGKKVYVCNTLWRNRLSAAGQARVKRFFDKSFKKAFRTYMDGFIEHQQMTKDEEQTYLKVKEGIAAFLMQYHIDFGERDITSLARDWYRHRDRNEANRVSPLVF